MAVKPVDGNHGRGISLDLSTREDVEQAYQLALPEGSEVIVERYVPGNEHRLLVVGSKVVAAARGEAAWVVGDGRSTIVELIDSQLNSDPRRGTTEDYPLNRILIDEDPAVRLAAAKIWSGWEGATSKLLPDAAFTGHYEEDEFALAFARIEAHYFQNRGFFARDGQLIDDADRLKGIPGVIIQGRYDVVTPMVTAWDLHRAWPEAEFVVNLAD